jgi:hypothetical protein
MSRVKDIENNKWRVIHSTRGRKNRVPKESSVKRIIKKIIQWRVIGYIVIGISLWKLNEDINQLSLQMFLLILFTELQSRGVSKQEIDSLKEELNLTHIEEPQYEDRKELRRNALHRQEEKDSLKAKESIEKNYPPTRSS